MRTGTQILPDPCKHYELCPTVVSSSSAIPAPLLHLPSYSAVRLWMLSRRLFFFFMSKVGKWPSLPEEPPSGHQQWRILEAGGSARMGHGVGSLLLVSSGWGLTLEPTWSSAY